GLLVDELHQAAAVEAARRVAAIAIGLAFQGQRLGSELPARRTALDPRRQGSARAAEQDHGSQQQALEEAPPWSISHVPLAVCRYHSCPKSGAASAWRPAIHIARGRTTMTDLPHLTASGAAHMVDIGEKKATRRVAIAEGYIEMSPQALA